MKFMPHPPARPTDKGPPTEAGPVMGEGVGVLEEPAGEAALSTSPEPIPDDMKSSRQIGELPE